MKLKLILSGLIAGFLLAACGSANQEFYGPEEASSQILGGEEVRGDDPLARSVVMIGQSGFEDCSATLISESVGVTAAHCADPRVTGRAPSPEGFFVKFRSGKSGLPEADRSVTAFRLPPRWETTAEELRRVLLPRMMDAGWKDWGDIALFRFEGGLPAGYMPAEIAGPAVPVAVGTPVVLAGFGSRADESLAGPDRGVLRKVTVNVWAAPAEGIELTFSQEDGRGSCKGDSGGPAFLARDGKYFLLGSTSRSVGGVKNNLFELCRQHSVYTDLRRMSDWLKAARAELDALP
ncbi:MAG: trypsin-like serine protease [Proteobacteria bacterium]|nr:MAG: trypsin-like serine protease [Pseudomonadota bacterium]